MLKLEMFIQFIFNLKLVNIYIDQIQLEIHHLELLIINSIYILILTAMEMEIIHNTIYL